MEADKLAIRRFIQVIHGADLKGWLILWTRRDKVTRAFDLSIETALDQASAYCAECAAQQDVYAAAGLQGEKPAGGSRGKEDGVVSVPGVWADIDIAGPAHKSKDLPPTEREAMQLVEAVGLPPSVIVRSGHGLQLYWLFDNPLIIETEAHLQNSRSLSRRFQQVLRIQAQTRGWKVDSTADLCRVLRVPGTFNRKISNDIRPVTAEYLERTYCLEDVDGLVSGLDDPGAAGLLKPQPDFSPANLKSILQGCAWMRHCQDDAPELPEPEWFYALTVVARCHNAEHRAHELSQRYSHYSHGETARKLRQASRAEIGPVTCAYVESALNGARYCSECLFRGHINSPITLGRLDTAEFLEAPTQEQIEDAPIATEEASPTTALAHVERFTDLGNARRFAARFRNQLLYCEKWSRWLVWDGRRWKEDETLEVYRLAGSLIRGLYALAKKISNEKKRVAFLSHLRKSESYRAQAAMLNLAKADSRFAVHPSDLDRDPWILAVENGTHDLRLGKLRPHNQTDRMTKLAPVVYDPSAVCPNWLGFLNMVMNDNTHIVSFLKRAFGSCLTGITSDKALYILYGPRGDNGKSTLIDAIQLLLGDYAVRTPTETFLRKKEGAIPNDVAKLKGARFVWASENERGSRLSESLIKEMTGGDKLSARFMRGEFFEFYPEFKPWLATNHKPQVRGDRALWNRLKLIPFEVSIPKDKQRPRHEVMEMFRAEFSGILNWLVEGCLEWQKAGLGVPDEVMEATREYEAEQDTFAAFLEEKCIRVASARVLSLALYRVYKPWSEEHGETPVSHKTFSSLMAERGFAKTKTGKGALYSGIGLRPEDHYDTAPARGVAREGDQEREPEGEEV
jgi:P4 family phage/plasmid primase-like protien